MTLTLEKRWRRMRRKSVPSREQQVQRPGGRKVLACSKKGKKAGMTAAWGPRGEGKEVGQGRPCRLW